MFVGLGVPKHGFQPYIIGELIKNRFVLKHFETFITKTQLFCDRQMSIVVTCSQFRNIRMVT